jgi:hypothetical protein
VSLDALGPSSGRLEPKSRLVEPDEVRGEHDVAEEQVRSRATDPAVDNHQHGQKRTR